jgi:glutamate-1-semialdehyde aminotransferase
MCLKNGDVAAVIIEGIQGIGGINIPEKTFLEKLAELTKKYGSLLILDEIQSGYGRSGRFFAFQYTDMKPDIITMAKGMGNGFPVGGILIQPEIQPWYGMLGTTLAEITWHVLPELLFWMLSAMKNWLRMRRKLATTSWKNLLKSVQHTKYVEKD